MNTIVNFFTAIGKLFAGIPDIGGMQGSGAVLGTGFTLAIVIVLGKKIIEGLIDLLKSLLSNPVVIMALLVILVLGGSIGWFSLQKK